MQWTLTLTKLLISCTLFYAVERFCHHQTDGFQITKVHSTLPPSPKWDVPRLNDEEHSKINQILSQPFTYLNRGGQCYAFVSEDKKVVLKLFKMHHLTSYQWMKHFPLPGKLDHYRLKLLSLQNDKLQRIFKSCSLAHSTLKEETGLIYLRLNPEENSDLVVKIRDKLNISHELDLSHVPFVLQSYAENPFQKLRSHLKNQDISSAKTVVREIVECLVDRYSKQILDTDPALRRNIGLLENRAVFIDIGSFVPAKNNMHSAIHTELYKETRRMDKWLNKRSLELKNYLDELIENVRVNDQEQEIVQ